MMLFLEQSCLEAHKMTGRAEYRDLVFVPLSQ